MGARPSPAHPASLSPAGRILGAAAELAGGGGGGEQRGPPARPGEVWGLERAQMESPENGGTVGRKKGVELPAQAQ